ncbi:Aste57867_9530 [Aphanomyces stellatus]|uniref:Aste57867_9530 protein n=1 Tax=Aphanomyces stellatus TaxID=120398 RepID=A0A485KN13_9STRA|nr:hypothetical protein As57867_009493 [Aphanomyces stellatus]VFT86409.1 Aste57867_9530 [Aphanomyces stellatus]
MMQRVVFAAVCAAALVSADNSQPFRRWASNPCVDVEGGARFCFDSQHPCGGSSFGECPKAGTIATGRCSEETPSFTNDGPNEGRCVLKVDTQCVKRSVEYVCAYTGNPQAGPQSGQLPPVQVLQLPSHPVVTDEPVVHSAGVQSEAASATKGDSSSTNTNAIAIGAGAVAAVAVVAFLAYRKRNSPHKTDDDDKLVTPAAPHPEAAPAPNLLGSGPLTPTLETGKSKIFSV